MITNTIMKLENRVKKTEQQLKDMNEKNQQHDKLIQELKQTNNTDNNQTQHSNNTNRDNMKNTVRKQVFNPPSAISPGEGSQADPTVPVGIAWAEVIARIHKPKLQVTTDFLDRNPEYKDNQSETE